MLNRKKMIKTILTAGTVAGKRQGRGKRDYGSFGGRFPSRPTGGVMAHGTDG